jgi:hypothetical protein
MTKEEKLEGISELIRADRALKDTKETIDSFFSIINRMIDTNAKLLDMIGDLSDRTLDLETDKGSSEGGVSLRVKEFADFVDTHMHVVDKDRNLVSPTSGSTLWIEYWDLRELVLEKE